MGSETAVPVWHGLVAGATSAIFSRLVTYPPDTVKARLQVQGRQRGHNGRHILPEYTGTVDAFVKIARKEGFVGFYRGFGAIVLTVIPANMCYFSGYELGRRIAPKNWSGPASDLLTATIAQTIAGLAFCPIDIVKQRVQTAVVVEKSLNSKSAVRMTPVLAAREVWSQRGISGFYRGFLPMNALWMPWNLVYLSLYESSKRRIYRYRLEKIRKGGHNGGISCKGDVTILSDPPMHEILPAWAYPVSSSHCAAIAAVVTHPIDVVKTRLQVLSLVDNGKKQQSALQVAAELWQEEGPRGFSRGLFARVATLSMGTSLSWFVYEMAKRQLRAFSAEDVT